MMYFYLFYENNELVGYLKTDKPTNSHNAKEVTAEEYCKITGMPYQSILQELVKEKYNIIDKTCEDTIHKGFQLETSEGIETFSLTEQDQTNLLTAYSAIQSGKTKYLYHANKDLCRVFNSDEIKAIGDAATSHKIYHTTYCNHLFRWLERVTTLEELDQIYYGAELPEDLATHMQTIIAESELLSDSTVKLNEETGIYSINSTT